MHCNLIKKETILANNRRKADVRIIVVQISISFFIFYVMTKNWLIKKLKLCNPDHQCRIHTIELRLANRRNFFPITFIITFSRRSILLPPPILESRQVRHFASMLMISYRSVFKNDNQFFSFYILEKLYVGIALQ